MFVQPSVIWLVIVRMELNCLEHVKVHMIIVWILNDSDYIKNHAAIEHLCVAINSLACNSENQAKLSGACEGQYVVVSFMYVLHNVICTMNNACRPHSTVE